MAANLSPAVLGAKACGKYEGYGLDQRAVRKKQTLTVLSVFSITPAPGLLCACCRAPPRARRARL
jgi:hypothetical protein